MMPIINDTGTMSLTGIALIPAPPQNWNNASFFDDISDGPTNGTANQMTSSCLAFQFYLYSVSMGILCVLGFIGNTVSFLVLSKDASTPVASFLLKTIAIADNSFLILWMNNYSLRYFIKYFDLHMGPVYLYVRVALFPMLYIAQTYTIWLTVVIALNRFMAVCLPYRAPHLCTIYNVYKEVASVTAFSILYNIPRFFELEIKHQFNPVSNVTETVWNRTRLGQNATYTMVYIDALYYLFSFILPLLILAVVNTKVTVAYQASIKRRRRMTSRRAENENNITLVMIIVVLIFMLCQAPARIVQLVWSYNYETCVDYQFYLVHFSNVLEVLNSSNNFLVYFVFRKRFREILYENYCLVRPLLFGKRKQQTRGTNTATEGHTLVRMEKTQDTNMNATVTLADSPDLRETRVSVENDADHFGGNCVKV